MLFKRKLNLAKSYARRDIIKKVTQKGNSCFEFDFDCGDGCGVERVG